MTHFLNKGFLKKNFPNKDRQTGKKRFCLKFLTLITFMILAAAWGLPQYMAGPEKEMLEISTMTDRQKIYREDPALRLMTLNIAHGRKDRLHQIMLSKSEIKDNLDLIAQVVRKTDPDILALQEADMPSIWSGNFNHVRHISISTFLGSYAQARHVDGLMLSYGTAIASKTGLIDPVAHRFAPSPPTLSKGFVLSTIPWPVSRKINGFENEKIFVDVVSVHLDFSRSKVQKKQVNEMITSLSARTNPLIVMGDFNSEWSSGKASAPSALELLAQSLGLSAYRPQAKGLETFSILGKRLDWILISPEFEFISYKVLPDIVSDHLGVCADITIKEK